MNKKSKEIIRLIMILIGNILDSAGFVLFVSGSGLITGGTSGIGLFLSRQTGIPTSVYVFIINAIMLLVGLIILGKRFAISTILSTFCYPLSMAVMEHVLHGQSLTNDIFLCTIMGGILIGTGVGLVIRAGASSGGMDIPPLIMNKYLRLPLSTGVYMVDFIILALQALQTPGDNVLYGVVLVIVYSVLIEKINEIRQFILRDLDRGVTMMKGRSGYLGKDVEVVMSVISSRQLSRVERVVHEMDPTAFMVVNRVSAVVGEGFTYPSAPDPVVEETSAP